MSDFDGLLAEFIEDRGQAQAEGDALVKDPAIAAVERRAILERAAARGDVLAQELLQAAQERAEKAERDRLVAEAEALLEQQGVDYDDPGVQAALRVQAQEIRATANARIRARERERLLASGAAPEGVDAALREQEAANAWFEVDALYSHPAWQRHETDVFEAERQQLVGRRYGGLEAAADEAEVEIELARRRGTS